MNQIARILLISTAIVGCTLQVFPQAKIFKLSTEKFAETSPKINHDGTKMVFASNKLGLWNIFICNHDKAKAFDNWSEPELIKFEGVEQQIDLKFADPFLNLSGDVLYFSANLPSTNGGMDIFYSKNVDGTWTQPQKLSDVVNTFIDEEAPMLSADENYLFFVRKYLTDKNDEFIYKIFYSKKSTQGTWQEPILASTQINSGTEHYPWLCADNKTLFFSSKRENDLDGYNLYFSKMLADNIWTDPKPITILNSDEDDISPSVYVNSSEIYYSRYLEKRNDIYADLYIGGLSPEFIPDKVFVIEGKVTDKDTGEPIPADISVRYADNMKKVLKVPVAMPNGDYTLYFPKGRELEFEASAVGYSHEFKTFDAGYSVEIPGKPVDLNFQLFNQANLILNVFDEEIFEPLKSEITVTNSIGTQLPADNINYLDEGRIELTLNIGYVYTMLIKVKNYEDYTFSFDLTGIVQSGEFERDVELTPSKTPFEINISDVETDEAIDEVEVVITNLEKDETIVKKVRKDADGKFVIDLRDGDKYEINVNGPKGYAFYNTKVDMNETENKKLDVKLKPLKAKTKLVLKDITFETNSADLNASSFEELDRVVKLLKNNPEIKIEISAHTDDVGSEAYNLKLSHKRAQSVVDYLTRNELPVDRLIAKGYGESKPLVPNDTDENKAKNRRVELNIVDVNQETSN